MKTRAAVLTGALLLVGACSGRDVAVPEAGTPAAPPPELQAGADLYQANCASCHGVGGGGTDTGPPFLHPVYNPGHHGDQAFVNAALYGVRAHHWNFGDMPPVPGVTEAQALEIVAFVRWLQSGDVR